MGEGAVSCCFCGADVAESETDPIGIGVIKRWRPYDEDADWTVYAHRQCLFDRFHPESRHLFDVLDK